MKSPIKEVHIIHHSHCDLGFTDFPSTSDAQQQAYLKEAIQQILKNQRRPFQSRFRWTCEVYTILEKYLQANPSQKKVLTQLMRKGLFDVGAMPCHGTGFITKEDALNELERSATLRRDFYSPVAFHNDINGFPWGMIPQLRKNNVELVWMGLNLHNGGGPMKTPSFFEWQGPTGESIYAYIGYVYVSGVFWFEEEEWRRGPIPAAHDYWYHRPGRNDILNPKLEAVLKSYEVFQKKMKALLAQGYSHSVLAIQLTNMWRGDNDPCLAHLPEFVEKWNEMGLTPRLVLSTPSLFWNKIKKEIIGKVPKHRGDWPDWWSDILAHAPREASDIMESVRVQRDNESLVKRFGSSKKWHSTLLENSKKIILGQEHTFNAYNGVGEPYHDLTRGNCFEKGMLCLKTKESGLKLRASILQESARFGRGRDANCIEVCNPGDQPRQGWVTIPFDIMPQAVQSVQDLKTKVHYPLVPVARPAWGDPKASQPPMDCWPKAVKAMKFYLSRLAPGESRIFEYGLKPVSFKKSSAEKKRVKFRGPGISELRFEGGSNLIQSGELLGRLRIEKYEIAHAKTVLEKRSMKNRSFAVELKPKSVRSSQARNPYGVVKQFVITYANFGKAEVSFWIPDEGNSVEIDYHLTLIESHEPVTVLIDFPISLPKSKVYYDSLGYPTQPNLDQLPGSCGDHYSVGEKVFWKSNRGSVQLRNFDAPLGAFNKISTRCGARYSKNNGRFYSIPMMSLWKTNVTIQKAGEYHFRYALNFKKGSGSPIDAGEMVAYPIR